MKTVLMKKVDFMKKSGGGAAERKYGISGKWRGELKGYSLPQ